MSNRGIVHGAILTALLLDFSVHGARGQSLEQALGANFEQRLPAIAVWTAHATGFPPPASMPAVDVGSAASLAAMRNGKALGGASDVLAVYDPINQIILLSDEWRGSAIAGWSIVVHEMVHHLQHVSGRRYACVQEQEEQAFAAQDAWLAAGGTTLEREFGIDAMTRLVASLCPY